MAPDLILAQTALRRAFPSGVAGDDYTALVRLLHDHYSDRNLAALIAGAFGNDAQEVYGCDIGRALEIDLRPDVLAGVQARLVSAGFAECIRETNS